MCVLADRTRLGPRIEVLDGRRPVLASPAGHGDTTPQLYICPPCKKGRSGVAVVFAISDRPPSPPWDPQIGRFLPSTVQGFPRLFRHRTYHSLVLVLDGVLPGFTALNQRLFVCVFTFEPVKFTFYIASFFMLQFLNGCVAILKTTFSTRAQRQCAVVLSMSVLQDSEDGLRQALSPRLHGRKYTVHCQPPPPLLPHPVGLRTLRRTNDGPNPRRFWGCCLRAAQLA